MDGVTRSATVRAAVAGGAIACVLAAGLPAQASAGGAGTAVVPAAEMTSPDRQFTITDLGLGDGTQATAMNDRTQVVGYTWTASGTRAWIWDPSRGVRTLRSRGQTFPADINSRGQVAGTVLAATWPYTARVFVWDASSGMRYLRMPSGWTGPEATALNESGQVLGMAYRKPLHGRAFVWRPGTGVKILPRLRSDSRHCEPAAINARGQVVGYCTVRSPDGRQEWRHAFRWDPTTGIRDLGNLGDPSWTVALAINDSGQVLGQSGTAAGNKHAFVWTPGRGKRDLGTLGGRSTTVFSNWINSAGQVIGLSQTSTDSLAERAFLWDARRGMTDLGTLGGTERGAPSGDPEEDGQGPERPPTEPRALNDTGRVVGVSVTESGAERAFVWSLGCGMVDLGTLSPQDESAGAQFINRRGQVLGTSGSAVVLWSPPVTVSAIAVRDRTRLRLNVNPNLGPESWRVTIQKRQPYGSWARVGTYRTHGSAETRTIDLPRGTYRVVVNTQKGFQRAVSAEVRLRR